MLIIPFKQGLASQRIAMKAKGFEDLKWLEDEEVQQMTLTTYTM